ncbi:MAG: polysaccharide biosynthesis/export family protein [Bacteroidales bacterium]|nr:polysaccharide biosynthesis/export family protein [Bacteroidales bacterium]
MKSLKLLIAIVASLLLMSSCETTKQISYFQDLQQMQDTVFVQVQSPEIRLRPDDKISIIVNTKDPELTALFNLPYTARILGQTHEGLSNTNQGASGYIIKGDGTIDFPVLGSIPAAGKTRNELASYIKNELVNSEQVKDPVVTVEFVNLQFSVMGEVRLPGRYNITRDCLTLLDAISIAGDMTIDGRRDNVLVLRPDTAGQLKAYHVDMRSFKSIQNSPVYYIHQNDYVYVEPNKKRANESTVNGNTVRSASFWISIVSLLSSLATTFTVILRR